MCSHGKWTAPAGNIVGAYRSILPNEFVGMMPCVCGQSVISVCSTIKGNVLTYIFDGWRDIHFSLILGVQALLNPLATLLHRQLLRTAFLDRHGPLLDPFQRFLLIFHSASDSHPILGRLARQDVGSTIDGLAAESADLAFGLDYFFALQMPLENVSGHCKPCNPGLLRGSPPKPAGRVTYMG